MASLEMAGTVLPKGVPRLTPISERWDCARGGALRAGCRLRITAIRSKGTLLCLLFLCLKTKRSWSNNSLTTSLVFCFVFLQPFLLLCFFGFLIWFIDLSAVMIIDLVLGICSGVDTIGELNKTGPY